MKKFNNKKSYFCETLSNFAVSNTATSGCFAGATIIKSQFKNVTFLNCDFGDCVADSCLFENCIFVGTCPDKFIECNFTDCMFIAIDFYGVNIVESTVNKCQFSQCKLADICIDEAIISMCDFRSSDLENADQLETYLTMSSNTATAVFDDVVEHDFFATFQTSEHVFSMLCTVDSVIQTFFTSRDVIVDKIKVISILSKKTGFPIEYGIVNGTDVSELQTVSDCLLVTPY